MRLGRREPGFYMDDVDRKKPKRIVQKYKDSLGKKRFEVVSRIRVVTEDGSEGTITLAGNAISFQANTGRVMILPRVSNVIDVGIGEHADF